MRKNCFRFLNFAHIPCLPVIQLCAASDEMTASTMSMSIEKPDDANKFVAFSCLPACLPFCVKNCEANDCRFSAENWKIHLIIWPRTVNFISSQNNFLRKIVEEFFRIKCTIRERSCNYHRLQHFNALDFHFSESSSLMDYLMYIIIYHTSLTLFFHQLICHWLDNKSS